MKRYQFLNLTLLFLITFCIGVGIGILPIFENKFETEFIESDQKLIVTEEETIEPYIWDNTTIGTGFGSPNIKIVNWTYFKQLFLQNTFWRLQYKLLETSEWTNGNQYMSIEKSWNESLSGWKFNLIFDAPVDVYQARFIFACNLSVLQYVNVSDEMIFINYTLSNGDVYHCYFNYTDLKDISGLYFKRGTTNNKFWFLFGRYNIPAGHYEFDPVFGCDVAETVGYGDSIEGYLRGIGNVSPSSDGVINNITAFLRCDNQDSYIGNVSCGIYYYENLTYIAKTEERLVTIKITEQAWYVFNITGTHNVYNEYNYLIVAWAENDGENPVLTLERESSSSGNRRMRDNEIYDYNYPNPFTVNSNLSGNHSIYCSYTTGEVSPDWWDNDTYFSNEFPLNNSFDNSYPSLDFNVTLYCQNDSIDWVLECNNSQSNSSNNDGNGSKVLNLTGLVEFCTYTVFVNCTSNSSSNVTKAIYYFTTENSTPIPSDWLNVTRAWWSFKNTSSYNTINNSWWSFKNTSIQKTINHSWWTFSNTSTYETINNSWWSFSNTSAYIQITQSWWSFKNTSSYNTINNSWWLFSNTSNYNTINHSWWNFSNSSTLGFITINNSWWSFSNSTIIEWLNVTRGWWNFSNSSTVAWQTINNSWWTFSNTSSYNTINQSWWNFSNSSEIETIVYMSNPSPANGSIDNLISTDLNIYIYDSNSSLITWSIECSNGESSSGTAYNSTQWLNLSDLNSDTNYTWWVNISSGGSSLNNWYWFITGHTLTLEELESEVLNIGVSAEFLGIIIFLVLLILAERKNDIVYFIMCMLLALPMGVYYIGFSNSVFGNFLGLALLLLSVYFSFLIIYYAFKRMQSDNWRKN